MQAVDKGRPEPLAELLADDFLEFGASGKVWNKAKVLAAVVNRERSVERSIRSFRVRKLGPDHLLATYEASENLDSIPGVSLRSSIWRRSSGGWQMLFHQGTPSSGISEP